MISVIVPIYNAEKYLDECISSILKSSLKDFELLLINDGSTDRSIDICEKYLVDDNRVKLINQHNLGVSVARNQGINLAKGEWIIFVDADDVISSDYLEIVNNMSSGMQDVILFNYEDVIEEEIKKNNNVDNSFIIYGEREIRKILEKTITGSNDFNGFNCSYGTPWAKAFKRSIIIDNNINYTNGMSIGEDKIFNIKYYLNCKNVCYIDKKVYFWRQHEDSVMFKFDLGNIKNDKYYNLELKKFLINEGLYNDFYNAYFNSVISGIEFMLYNQIFSPQNKISLKKKIELCRETITKDVYWDVINNRVTNISKYKKFLILLLKNKMFFSAGFLINLKKRLSR